PTAPRGPDSVQVGPSWGRSTLTGELTMRLHCPICQVVTVAALLCVPVLTYAQTPTAAVSSTSNPGKSTVKVDMVPSLFVMNARGATLQGQTLTLASVSPTSIVFADRPVRAAGHLPTEALLEEWTTGDFAKDAPNATISVLSKDGLSAHDVVLELRSPHLEGDRLTFDVRVLEGALAGADGPAVVFVGRSHHSPSRAWPAARRRGPTATPPRQPRTTAPLCIPWVLPSTLRALSIPLLTRPEQIAPTTATDTV